MLHKILILIGALCLFVPAHADHPIPAATSPDETMVNLAGQQRMLSQRIVKAYAQIGLDVMPVLARQQMHDAILRFAENLDALAAQAPVSPDASLAREDLARTWQAFHESARRPVSREAALMLSRQSLAVLDGADRLTKLVEQASPAPGARFVNRAGSLRMLSQRLAKSYLLFSWGIREQDVRDEFDETMRLFGERLAWLMAQPDNTAVIRAELEAIELQWTWLRTAVAADGPISYRLVVVEAADSILADTDQLTRLYEQRDRH